jgi:hypothetical protein
MLTEEEEEEEENPRPECIPNQVTDLQTQTNPFL